MKRVLIISQVITREYLQTIVNSIGENAIIDVITGSNLLNHENVNIISAPQYVPRSIKARLISWYKHYRFIQGWIRNNRDKKYDLIYATSNPPINSKVGLYLKRVYKCPFIYMNWDLYPQVIRESMDGIFVRTICKMWSIWNGNNFNKIDKVLTIGKVMAESINMDLKNKIDVGVIPIPVNTEVLKPIKKECNPFLFEHNLQNKFVVLYSGKMGKGHNIEVILEAADILKNHPEIVFLIIGSGEKVELVKEHLEINSSNILLMDFQPEDVYPYSIASGDIGLVSQESKMAHLFMPSKVFSMMACGEAIIGICSEHDDLNSLISDNNIGFVITNADASSLASRILELYRNSNALNEMKRQSRTLAVSNYSQVVIEQQYRDVIREVII